VGISNLRLNFLVSIDWLILHIIIFDKWSFLKIKVNRLSWSFPLHSYLIWRLPFHSLTHSILFLFFGRWIAYTLFYPELLFYLLFDPFLSSRFIAFPNLFLVTKIVFVYFLQSFASFFLYLWKILLYLLYLIFLLLYLSQFLFLLLILLLYSIKSFNKFKTWRSAIKISCFWRTLQKLNLPFVLLNASFSGLTSHISSYIHLFLADLLLRSLLFDLLVV